VQFSGDIDNDLESVYFVDDNTGWIVGDQGCILHTNNAGQDWIFQNSDTSSPLSDICFADKNNGCAIGYDGIILKTCDGGATWEKWKHITSDYLGSVFLIDSANGWIVGGRGKILQTYPYGPVSIEDNYESPYQQISPYTMFKAYSNNFNFNIHVEYTVSDQSFISLVMYDLQGKEIRSLLNKFHNTGTYSCYFNVKEIPAGIYILRLQTDTFNITRKLQIVR
jgi:hypothetical protein